MEIETDFSAIRNKEPVAISPDKNVDGVRVKGLRTGNRIRMSPDTPMKHILTLTHEVGHIIGDELSFKSGEVKTPDQLAEDDAYIDLTPEEVEFLAGAYNNPKAQKLDRHTKNISYKLLEFYTFGRFDPNKIRVDKVGQQELEVQVKKSAVSTIKVDSDGNLFAINAKSGRDVEMPAMTTEIACMKILENTMRHYGISSENQELVLPTTSSTPHQRASNIIARAHKRTGWTPPSMKDIRERV